MKPLDSLTGLRFWAALHVVAFHFAKSQYAEAPTWLLNILASGTTSVSVFFVLSGFVLTYTYLGRQRDGRLNRAEFWLARFARIYPIYALSILAMFVYHLYDLQKRESLLAGVAGLGAPLLAGLTATQKWFPDIFLINAPGWSISVEVFFYALFPLLAPAAATMRWRRLLAVTLASWLVLSVAPTLFIYANVARPPIGDDFALVGYGVWVKALVTSPLMRLPELLLGICAGRLFLDRHVRRSSPQIDRRGPVLIALASAALIVLLLAGSDNGQSALVYRGMLAPLFAVLIYSLACLDWSGLRLPPLASRPLVLLGEASYGLYIIQVPVATWLEWVTRRLIGVDGLWDSWAFLGFYLVVVLALAFLSFYLYEQPARRLIRRRTPGFLRALASSAPRALERAPIPVPVIDQRSRSQST